MIDILEEMLEACDLIPEGPFRATMQLHIYTLFDMLININETSDDSSLEDPIPY
jgi:hypothetical protein